MKYLWPFFLFLAGCAHLGAPNWKYKSNKPLKLYSIKASDGYFEASFPGLSQPILNKASSGDYYYIASPIQDDGIVECYLFKQLLDPGHGHKKLLDNISGKIKTDLFEVPAYTNSETSSLGLIPIISSDHVLFSKDNPNSFQNLKIVSYELENNSLICLLNTPKLLISFNEMLLSFIQSIKFSYPSHSNPKSQMSLALIGGKKKKYGFTKTITQSLDEFSAQTISITSQIFPANYNDLLVMDEMAVEVFNTKKNLLSGKYILVRNNETVYELAIERSAKNLSTYRVWGQYFGKSWDEEISSSYPLVPQSLIWDILQQKTPLTFAQFLPAITPSKLVTVEKRKDAWELEHMKLKVLEKKLFEVEVYGNKMYHHIVAP